MIISNLVEMEEEEKVKLAFAALRPHCVRLSKEHSRDNIQAVRGVLEQLEQCQLQQLQEYILFPLRLVLKQAKDKSEELYRDVVSCMTLLLKKTEVQSFQTCQDLLTTLCLLVSSPAQADEKLLSEELKLAIVQCLKTLVSHTEKSVVTQLHSVTFLPALGHAISLLLQYVQKEQLRQLRITSMECLLIFTLQSHKVGKAATLNAGQTFASFLPGISLALCAVITGDTKQGLTVISKAVEVWTDILCLVFGDKYLQKAQKQAKSGKGEPSGDKVQELVVVRSEDWVRSTADKLKVLVEKVSTVQNHSSWKVRQALVDWAARLLLECTESLSSCRPHLLKVLVGAVGDEYSTVAERGQSALEKFKAANDSQQKKPLNELLQENLHELATSLPRLMRTADDEKKLVTLKLVSGYIKILGPDVNSLLHSYSQLKRLGQALTQVLELDCSHTKILQERADLTMLESSCSSLPQRLKKYFKHFADEKVLQELAAICRLLGEHGDISLLTDHFMEQFQATKLNRKQCIFILNEIMLGTLQASGRNNEEVEDIIRALLEVYLDSSYWDLDIVTSPTEALDKSDSPDLQVVTTKDSDKQSVEQLNSNIWQCCLLLEGVGNFAKVLGDGFQNLLMDVLYPVLEKLGAESVAVSHTAFLTLMDICQSCDYKDIEELVYQNADYLVNSISLRMRHLSQNLKAPIVFRTMIQHSGPQVLPLVEDTVQEILRCLDDYYGEAAILFLRVLYAVVSAVVRWYPNDKIPAPERKRVCYKHYRDEKDVRDFFVDYLKQIKVTSGEFEEEDLETDPVDIIQVPEYAENDPEKKDVPKHILLVKQIMERCAHVLSSENPRVRLLVLDTVGQAAVALRHHQDVLLPLVHKVWPGFVQRFVDEEQVVSLKAFETLSILGEASGDFLYRRVITDILPKLNSSLLKQAEVSCSAGPAYKFTLAYKYQLHILQKIPTLCKQVGVEGENLDKVMRACLPYLSARQPKALQQGSLDAFRVFSQVDADAVWLLLCDVYMPYTLVPPDPCFPAIKMAGTSKRTEFTDNISLLLGEDTLRLDVPIT